MSDDPVRRVAAHDGHTTYSALQPGEPEQRGIDNLLMSSDPGMQTHGRLLATGVGSTLAKWLAEERQRAVAAARSADDLSDRLHRVLSAATNVASSWVIQAVLSMAAGSEPADLDQLVTAVAKDLESQLLGKLHVWRQWQQAEKTTRGGAGGQ